MVFVMTVESLREILLRLPDVDDVQVSKVGRKLVATVVASRFEGVDEGERQSEIWDLLLGELKFEQRRKIEFVFTDTPEELRQSTAGVA